MFSKVFWVFSFYHLFSKVSGWRKKVQGLCTLSVFQSVLAAQHKVQVEAQITRPVKSYFIYLTHIRKIKSGRKEV